MILLSIINNTTIGVDMKSFTIFTSSLILVLVIKVVAMTIEGAMLIN